MDREDSRYDVLIADEALQMLISHARFLAQVSETAASRLIEVFEEKAISLKFFPDRNPWLSDPLIPAGKYRKMLIEKRYLLLYQVKGKTVYIEAVVDTRQNYNWL